jgi:hypothetical protein
LLFVFLVFYSWLSTSLSGLFALSNILIRSYKCRLLDEADDSASHVSSSSSSGDFAAALASSLASSAGGGRRGVLGSSGIFWPFALSSVSVVFSFVSSSNLRVFSLCRFSFVSLSSLRVSVLTLVPYTAGSGSGSGGGESLMAPIIEPFSLNVTTHQSPLATRYK